MGKTEIRYTQSNFCKKHGEELTTSHIKSCDSFQDIGNLDQVIKRLKTTNIREWDSDDIVKGISDAIRITNRIEQLRAMG